jgi:hypothetical protein
MADLPAPRRGLIGLLARLIARLIARIPTLSKPDAELLARIKFPCC